MLVHGEISLILTVIFPVTKLIFEWCVQCMLPRTETLATGKDPIGQRFLAAKYVDLTGFVMSE